MAKYLKLSPKNILLTAGCDAGIKNVFETFINKKDLVLRTNPTFAMYSVYSKIFNVKEILINYFKTDLGPKIDIKKIMHAVKKKKPRLICIPNPDSPTGHCFTSYEIESLLKIAKKVNALVLVDEVYYPFYSKSCKNLIKKYSNLIVIRSTSKSWGLAGMRVGYVLAALHIIKEMHKVKPMYEISNIGGEVFRILLDKNLLMKSSIKRLLKGKQYFKKEILKLGFNVFNNEEGNFIHVDFKKNKKKIFKELNKIIYFRSIESHKSLKNFSRFTITSKENFKHILRAIKKCIKKN